MGWWNKKKTPVTIREELIKSVIKHEGFEAKPYIDVLVAREPEQHGIPPDEFAIIEKHLSKLKLTFGNGLTFITEIEAKRVTEMRVMTIKQRIVKDYSYITNYEVLDVLTEMAYQLGFNGLSKFKKMFYALENNDTYGASLQMKYSKWYDQTPNRVQILMDKMEAIKSIRA